MTLLPLWLFAAVALGVILGLAVPMPPPALAACLVVALARASIALTRRDGAGLLVAALSGAAVAAWTLTALDDGRARDPPLAAACRLASPVILEGTISSDAVPDGNGVRLRVSVSRVDGLTGDMTGDVSLSVGGRQALASWPGWRAGRQVALRASVHRPAMYQDDGVGDDRLALARRGLVLVGSVKSAAFIELRKKGSGLAEWCAALRAHVRAAIAGYVGRRDALAGAIATAILIGDRTSLDPKLVDRLQAAGTYHVIAISGGNIAIFATTLLGAAWLLRVPTPVASLGAIVAVWLYAMLVGGGASVVRAAAMATVYLALRVVDLRAAPLCALAATALAMLVLSPMNGVDAGFVLTVGATGAIVALTPRLMRLVADWPRVLRPAFAVVMASIATELVLLPISARLFGRVTLAGPLLNLAAVPAMALVQQAGMAVVCLAPWWSAGADLAGRLALAGASVLVGSADLLGWMPSLAARVPAPAWWPCLLYVAAGASIWIGSIAPSVPGAWRRRFRRTGIAGAVTAASWIVSHPATWRTPWKPDGRLHLTSIDVGQGDATLLRLPDATTMLVDAGGLGADAQFDIGARVVAPAIWARGIGWIDGLVLTHGDPDHIGGAGTIIDVFRPPRVWEGIPVPSHAPMAALRQAARARGLSWDLLTDGVRWQQAGVHVRVWHPEAADWERRRVRNDDSIVLELRLGDVSIVLPGDIGRDVEAPLAARLPPARIRVLKLAHHGSASSSSDVFLDGLRPTIAIVSCGRDNRFGHPAPPVMARLDARRIPVLRTDLDGEIDLDTDGRRVTVRTVDQGP